MADGIVYIGSDDDKLYAFDAAGNMMCGGAPKACAPLWTVLTGGPVASPALGNGMVYVGSGDARLYAYGLEKVPPTTSIVIPSSGATLSGASAQLDASASDNVKVSRVEFRLTGGNYQDASIGFATETQGFGWIYYWNTKSVPNGTYTLNSVAYDPAGNTGRSADVMVTVHN